MKLRGQELGDQNHFHSPSPGDHQGSFSAQGWRKGGPGGAFGNQNGKVGRVLRVQSGREAGELLPGLLQRAWRKARRGGRAGY